MSVAAATVLTAVEFAEKFNGRHVELLEGVVKEPPVAGTRHGYVCLRAGVEIWQFVDGNKLGRVMSNDTFVLTRRSPDTVRGADVCYWSFQRFPRETEIPDGIIETPPDLVLEVRSPSDRWNDIFTKVGEYLAAGVSVVIILDPETATASVYRDNEFQQIFDNGDDLVIPDVLPGFSVPVRRFFEA